MTRYAIVDVHSGYIWGVQDAANEIEACRLMDENLGEYDRKYEHGQGGYMVFIAPTDFECDNGQDEGKIEQVSCMPLAASIKGSREYAE